MSDVTGAGSGGDDIDMVAAEYVLGTLDLDERLAFVERMRNDEAARSAALRWERRLEKVAGWTGETAPPADGWNRIEQALFSSGSNVAGFRVVEGGRGKSDQAHQLERSRNRWRTAALMAGGIAAALVVFIASQLRPGLETNPSATYIAAVNRGGDKPALIVSVDLKTQKVYVHPVAAEAPPGHSLELWYIQGEQPPKSLGLVRQTTETLAMPESAKSGSATFAVSVEPVGGSKTGGPTGPVVYSGQLIKQ